MADILRNDKVVVIIRGRIDSNDITRLRADMKKFPLEYKNIIIEGIDVDDPEKGSFVISEEIVSQTISDNIDFKKCFKSSNNHSLVYIDTRRQNNSVKLCPTYHHNFGRFGKVMSLTSVDKFNNSLYKIPGCFTGLFVLVRRLCLQRSIFSEIINHPKSNITKPNISLFVNNGNKEFRQYSRSRDRAYHLCRGDSYRIHINFPVPNNLYIRTMKCILDDFSIDFSSHNTLYHVNKTDKSITLNPNDDFYIASEKRTTQVFALVIYYSDKQFNLPHTPDPRMAHDPYFKIIMGDGVCSPTFVKDVGEWGAIIKWFILEDNQYNRDYCFEKINMEESINDTSTTNSVKSEAYSSNSSITDSVKSEACSSNSSVTDSSQDDVFIYVLELEKGKFYVGQTKTTEERYGQHLTGKGSAWTKQYQPIHFLSKKRVPSGESAGFAEDMKVKEMMKEYGIENVRGGSYSQITLSESQIDILTLELNHENNRCFKCGSSDHWATQCNKIEQKLKTSSSCFRCGRYSHTAERCYAKTDTKGHTLK